MADTLYTSQIPAVQNDFDGSSHAWGIKFTVSADCNLTGGRVRVPTGGRPTTFKWQVWRMSDSSKVAETDLNGAGHGSPAAETWMSFDSSLFTAPGNVALDDAETYIACVAFTGGQGCFTDDGSESFPLTSGGLASGSTGRYTNAGGTDTMPANDYTAYFFADVSVQASGGAPVAATGLAAAAATSTSTAKKTAIALGAGSAAAAAAGAAAKVSSPAGTSTAAGTSTSSARKTAQATGTAAGTAAATSTAAKVVHCTATCSTVTATTTAAATVRPASAASTAAPATLTTAAKHASTSSMAYAVANAWKSAHDIRAITATCYAIAASTLRHRRIIQRPNTGIIARPNTGVILRP